MKFITTVKTSAKFSNATIKPLRPVVQPELDTDIEALPWQYRELLVSQGLMTVAECMPLPDAMWPEKTCCDETWINTSGETVCYGCQRVVSRMPNLVSYNKPAGEGKRSNWGYQIQPKKRGYQTRTHFMMYLKRYMCSERQELPQELLGEIGLFFDKDDPDIYFAIRAHLRKRRQSQHYGQIFAIIYECGGYRPEISTSQYCLLKRKILNIQAYFYQNRDKFQRNSMPCVPYMLERLLAETGCPAFYQFNKLKAPALQAKAETFFQIYQKDCGCHIAGDDVGNLTI